MEEKSGLLGPRTIQTRHFSTGAAPQSFSILGSKVSSLGAEVSGHFGINFVVPKCLVAEVSMVPHEHL